MTREHLRLQESRERTKHWKRWGPYVSERAWGTVREDYSEHGTAWDYFPHDHARSRAYRWNEDGLAGICDRHQILCFALALWNGNDPILKERLFGLTGSEVRALRRFYHYYGDEFKVECPTGSGKMMNLLEVSAEIASRVVQIFRRSEDGKRPVYGKLAKFQDDPHWRDYLQFHEYFHGDSGFGIGAAQQSGWTALVAKLIDELAEYEETRSVKPVAARRIAV